MGEFYQTFKKEVIVILYKLFQEIEDEGMPLNLFYETGIILFPKPDKNTMRK